MRKKKVLIISAVAAVFVVTAGFAIQGHGQANRYKQLLENSYTHAYYELTTAVSELDTDLQKVQYVTTPTMLEVLCADIYSKAVAAQMALGELPASAAVLEQTSAFLARTGDYANALTKTTATSHFDTENIHTTLQGLAKVSSSLSSSLLDLQSDLDGGSVSIDLLIRAEEALAQHMHDGEAGQGGTTFQSIESDFPETPSLIYDGPFSEHLSNKTPLALEGLPQLGRDEARANAAEFLGIRPEILTPAGKGDGVLPTWGFTATMDGGEIYIEVTRQGGKILSLLNSRAVRETNLSADQAVDIAHSFLKSHHFDCMQESYHINQGNVLTINFAPAVQDVLCYPDLIKVSVALDTGSIVGFESHGWIMNHAKRDIPTPTVDKAAAEGVLSPHLTILSHQLTLIPSKGEYEVLCHEFKCKSDENINVIVYVNAATGSEEKILLLMEDENGTLVW